MLRLLVTFSFAICAACNPADDYDTLFTAAGAFGASCTTASDCSSNVCGSFMGENLCTQSCSTNDDCPSGSKGQKCNNMGICRP